MTMKKINSDLAPLMHVLQEQAKLLGSMQAFLKTQQRLLQTLINSSEKVTNEYNDHISKIIKLRKTAASTITEETPDDNKIVDETDNGSTE